MIRSRARMRNLILGGFACIFAALCVALPAGVGADTAQAALPSDLRNVRLTGRVAVQVNDLQAQADHLQAEIDALDLQLERASESYNHLQVRLDELNVRMADLRRELRDAESDHAYRIKKLEARICSLYKAGGRGDELLGLLVSATGIEDFLNRVRLATTLAGQDRRIVENLVDSTGRLNSVLAEVDNAKREQLSLRRQADSQRERIRSALAERENALEGIDSEVRAIIEAEAARQEQERQKLEKALEAMLNGGQIYDGPLPQTDSEVLSQVLETAAYYMGIPYVWAGDRPSTGFDCSGFTQYVFGQHGVYLPHYSGFQAQMGLPVTPEEIMPGDLLAFGCPVHHVGIYVGQGLFIHAPRTGDVIRVSHLSEKNNLAAIRRFPLQPRMGEPSVW